VSDKSDGAKVGRYPYYVLVLCWLVWFYIFVERIVLSGVLPSVELELGISHADAGLLLTAMMMTLALTSLPAGLLSSRIGAKRTILLSLVIITSTSFLLSQATDYAQLAAGLLVLGVGLGAFFPSCIALLAQWFPTGHLGRAIGIVETAPPFGYLFGVSVVIAVLVIGLGWQWSYMLLALPGLVLLVMFWLVVKERPEEAAVEERKVGLRQILKMRYVMLFLLPFIFNAMYVRGVTDMMPLYLVSTHGTDVVFANSMFIIINVFGIPGPIIAGWCCDKFGRESTMAILLAVMGLATFAFVLLPMGWPLIGLMSLVNLVNCGYYPVAFTFASEKAPPSARAPIVGLYLFTSFFFGALTPFVVGFIGDIWNLNAGFVFPAALVMVGAFFILFVMRRKMNGSLNGAWPTK